MQGKRLYAYLGKKDCIGQSELTCCQAFSIFRRCTEGHDPRQPHPQGFSLSLDRKLDFVFDITTNARVSTLDVEKGRALI